jgi:hypothetical protein
VSAKENERTEPEDTQTDAVAWMLSEFFREHPAILGSITYVLVTAIGIIYSGILYQRFGINIFDFADMNDLLLAAFKDAFAFAMTLVTLFLGLGFVLLLRKMALRHAREGIDRPPCWLGGLLDCYQGSTVPSCLSGLLDCYLLSSLSMHSLQLISLPTLKLISY